MRKIALVLALLLLLTALTACKKEAKVFTVNSYNVKLTLDEGWQEPTVDPDAQPVADGKPNFDSTYISDDAQAYVMAFRINSEDFVDPPVPSEEVSGLEKRYFSACEEVQTLAEPETQELEDRSITLTKFSASEEGKQWHYLSYRVEFQDEYGSFVWVLFRGSRKYMDKNADYFRQVVEGMTLG